MRRADGGMLKLKPGFYDVPAAVVTTHVLCYATIVELCHFACISRPLREMCEQDDVWLKRINAHWENKLNVTPGSIFPAANFSDAALATLSVKELKQVCAFMHISASRFLDKTEFRNAIAAVRKTRSFKRAFGMPRQLKFKASYVCAELDSRRTVITEDELCSIEWAFFFKHNPHSFKSIAKFHADGHFTMKPWPMPDPESLSWRRNSETGVVQIHHFPGHRPGRMSNWGFTLQNMHVIFVQNAPGFNASAYQNALSQEFGGHDDDEDVAGAY